MNRGHRVRSWSRASSEHVGRVGIFGDEVVAAAMIDRLVHHAEILSLKGDSYRLRDKDVATRPRPALIDES
jgi:hypothetical protein